MARIITRPIISVIGDIKAVDLDRFIDPSHIAALICDNTALGWIAEEWAIKNKVELIGYLPNYRVFGRNAIIENQKDMINACDVVLFFYNDVAAESIAYAASQGRKYFLHQFYDLDS